ncbi:DMT family transporter [Bernardetia sp.]|uniref:DMT family transporter n=1 Tax=Bernardetia sp. TaxID=1937974 RepID=UPI0025C4F87C|nr:DMT family transporter [Bernardetia sp.]
MNTSTKNPLVLSWFLLILLALIWGSSFILMKRGLVVFSPLEIGALRMSAAFVALLPFAIVHARKIPKSKWKYLLVSGLVGNAIPAVLFPLAQTQLLSSVTGVLNALTPLFTVMVGALFFSQKLKYKQLIGLGVAFFGAGLLSIAKKGGGFGDINAYVLLVVLAAFFYAISLNVIKDKLSEIPSFPIASCAFLTVGIPSLLYLFLGTPFLSHFEEASAVTLQTTVVPSIITVWKSLFYIVILGVIGTAFALIIFNKVIQLNDAVFASTVTYLIPIVAIFWGVVDDEPLQTEHFIGMAMIIFGVFVANRWK